MTPSALLTDYYQLNMLDGYLQEGLQGTAVFELFVRRLPEQRHFLVAAGLEQALDFLEQLAFTDAEIAWLQAQGVFSPRLLQALRHWRFEGEVHAMPEGTLFFADEPVLRVTAPLPQAQLVESRLLNIVHFQTLIASKAARVVLAAPGRQLVDFGMRRAHGAEAALFAARAACLAGFDGTATAAAGLQFGLPLFGTMAHAYVQAHASETAAFEAFARLRRQGAVLLVDTYDTEAAVARLPALARRLGAEGVQLGGVRLDSGDLAAHARAVRRLLDEGGLRQLRIFASGNLDEHRIAQLLLAQAPIDGFGVGTALDTSADVPALDAVYKLQAYDGRACRKRSEGKATWPGAKQVARQLDAEGRLLQDTVQLADEPLPAGGAALLQPVMRGGRRLAPSPALAAVRAHHAAQMRTLPLALRSLGPHGPGAAAPCEVRISARLRALAQAVDTETR